MAKGGLQRNSWPPIRPQSFVGPAAMRAFYLFVCGLFLAGLMLWGGSLLMCRYKGLFPMLLKTIRPVLLLLALTACSAVNAEKCGAVAPEGYTNLCAGLSSSTAYEQMNRMNKPALRKPVRDRSFGSNIIRISDAGPRAVVKPMYSTVQAWNADESLLLLFADINGERSHELYDGRSYEWRQTLDINPSDIEEVFWHAQDPDTLFYIEKNMRRLMRYSIKSRRAKLLYDFNKVCDSALTTGTDTQMPSWDSRYMGLRCGGSSDTRALVLTFDLEKREIVARGLTGKGDGGEDRYNAWTAPAVAPSGDRMLFQGDVSTLKFERQRELAVYSSAEHSSLGKLPNGHDALYAVGFDPGRHPKRCDQSIGALVAHDLNDGTCNVVIGPSKGHGYPPTGTHISALAYRNPGWVALSSVGDSEVAVAGRVQKLFNSEIFLAYADPERPQICRVAHHRSSGRDNTKLTVPYYAEPHVSISPSGTRMIFGSDWHGGDSVDTYVVELPSYKPCTP